MLKIRRFKKRLDMTGEIWACEFLRNNSGVPIAKNLTGLRNESYRPFTSVEVQNGLITVAIFPYILTTS